MYVFSNWKKEKFSNLIIDQFVVGSFKDLENSMRRIFRFFFIFIFFFSRYMKTFHMKILGIVYFHSELIANFERNHILLCDILYAIRSP